MALLFYVLNYSFIFYDHRGYNGDFEVVSLRSRTTCVPLRALTRRVSSVKYAGKPEDYRAPTVTLYKGVNFTGREIYVTDEHPKALFGDETGTNLGGYSEPFGSLIVTGNSSSCWTLYENVGYGGLTSCVCGHETTDFYPLLVPVNPFPPSNMVGSVRKGCFESESDKKVVVVKGRYLQDGEVIGFTSE